MPQIQIEFQQEEHLKAFTEWFQREGLSLLISSKHNRKDNPITCLAADDKMEWGHYYELE